MQALRALGLFGVAAVEALLVATVAPAWAGQPPGGSGGGGYLNGGLGNGAAAVPGGYVARASSSSSGSPVSPPGPEGGRPNGPAPSAPSRPTAPTPVSTRTVAANLQAAAQTAQAALDAAYASRASQILATLNSPHPSTKLCNPSTTPGMGPVVLPAFRGITTVGLCPRPGAPPAPTARLVAAPQRAPAPPPPNPAVLAAQAERRLPLPAPSIQLDPPVGVDQLTQLETWMWVPAAQWHPFTATASAGGVSVRVTATPRLVRWSMGQGSVVVCHGPGTPYRTSLPPGAQHTSCGFTYRHPSSDAPGLSYRVTASITWTASYTVTGAPGGGPLPSVTRSASVAVRVAQDQTVVR